tara:strand:- start:134 stop:325 length:192 start_codon:yes stop_codon:yes gene_type:complete
MQVKGKLDELMDGSDWALIFGEDGHVKGIFIPEGKQESDVPVEMENLLRVMGINLYEDGASVH